jgi:hypothetical protein
VRDLGPDTLNVLHNFVIPKSQHCNALGLQPSCSALIRNLLPLKIVLTAIDLDGKPEPGAVKVNDVITDWMLTTKAEA